MKFQKLRQQKVINKLYHIRRYKFNHRPQNIDVNTDVNVTELDIGHSILVGQFFGLF